MPNSSQHQTKAKSNRSFLDTIDCDAHPDWAAVVAFYTAVHLVERLRALDGRHSVNHPDRLEYVQANHRAIHFEFHQLLNVSKLARYESNADFFAQLSSAEVREKVVGEWLSAIEQYVDRYVAARSAAKPPAKPTPPKKK